MRNKFLLFVLLITFSVSMWGERISQDDAALVANHFMNATPHAAVSGAHKAPAKRMVLKKVQATTEEQQFYIYENADGEGWVMVAANDIAKPILAYSHEGYFRTDNQPANVKCWLGKYNKQIKQAEENGAQATEEVKQAWKQLRKGVGIKKGTPVVAALIQTKWDQDDPYWKYCPGSGNNKTYVGCVATAMAQVMYYWKWPEKGTGSYSYTSEALQYSCSADFANTTYEWDKMLLKYNGYYPEGSSSWTTVSSGTTAQQNAVATLLLPLVVVVHKQLDLMRHLQQQNVPRMPFIRISVINRRLKAIIAWEVMAILRLVMINGIAISKQNLMQRVR